MSGLAGALELAERGYHLVPVTIRRRATDGKKIPEFHRGWSSAPTTDPDVIRDWTVQYPGCSFAIACGPSGIDVVDLDPKDGGPASWAALDGPTSSTVVRTPSGGVHLYWRQHEAGSIGTGAGGLGAGIDTRGDRGVVFAPGAVVLDADGVPEPVGYTGTLPKVADLDVVPERVRALAAVGRRTQHERSGQTSEHHAEWMREAVAEQRARVRAFDPRRETGFRELIMGAALVLGRAADAGLWSVEQMADALAQDAASVWGSADDDDREWIRRGLDEGPALERWSVRTEPGSNMLTPPPVAVTPLGNTPTTAAGGPGTGLALVQEGPAPALSAPLAASGPMGGVPAPAGSADEWAQLVAIHLRRLQVQHEARRLFEAEQRGPVAPPELVDLGALLAEPDESPAWLVDRLWPAGGKVLLAAAQKAGKTTMVGNLVRCLADGAPFLAKPQTELPPVGELDWKVAAAGYAVPTPARVALLDFEMTRRKLRDWLRDQRIVTPANVHVELMRGRSWDVRDPTVRGQWADHLRATGATVLIVDPIGPVLHGLGIDENDNSAVGGFLAALDALVLEAGMAELLVVHHTGHGTERARGASSFLGWPDANWRVVREELGDVRAFAAEGRDVWAPETVLEYDRDTRRLWVGNGGSRAQVKGSADAGLVVAIVAEECAARGAGQPGPGVRELEHALTSGQGWGKDRAGKAIRAARDSGQVHAHPGPNKALQHHPGASCDGCPVS